MLTAKQQHSEIEHYPDARTAVLKLAGQLDLGDIASWLDPAIKAATARGWQRLLIDFRLCDNMEAVPVTLSAGLATALSVLQAPRHWRYGLLCNTDSGIGYCMETERIMVAQRWQARCHAATHEAWMWITDGVLGLEAAVEMARRNQTMYGRGANAEWKMDFRRPDYYPSFIQIVTVGVLSLEDQLHLIEQASFMQAKTRCLRLSVDYRQAIVAIDQSGIQYKLQYLAELARSAGIDTSQRRDAITHNPTDTYMQRIGSMIVSQNSVRNIAGDVQSFRRVNDAGDWLLGKGGYANAMRQYCPLPSHRTESVCA